jgi:hypothetical protein
MKTKTLNTRILKKIGQKVKLEYSNLLDKYLVFYRENVKYQWREVMRTSSIKLAIQKKHCLTALIIRDIGLFMFFKDRRVKMQRILSQKDCQ